MKKNLIYFIITLSYSLSNQYYADFEIIVNNDPFPSNIFLHTQSSNFMAILDESLEPYWFVKSDNLGGIDFKPTHDYISYFDKNNTRWIIADKSMNEIDTLQCSSGLTDYHDIQILSNGNYILQAYDSLIVDMSSLIEGGNPSALVKNILRIQEFNENHELILDWSAFDHLNIQDFTNLNLTNSEFSWMHGNSIEIDYDDNIIISDRRSSQLIKIHRTTGSALWILGGPLNSFEIVNDSFEGFSKQHDARRLDNSNILLFDNGNNHEPPTSRVVEYQIDEENMIATLVWEFFNPYGDLSASMGSVQRLPNENTLINWGNIPTMGARIMEVDSNNNIVLELEFDIGSCYKVRKSDWGFNIPMIVGDSNLDGIINVSDIIYQINFILSQNSIDLFNLYKIDVNKDSNIDILDVVEMINIILSE
tara:strand:+ start:151 stop:1413 length:1263 start_codon:yes stop_codon:yes gene_type:complete